MGVVKDIVHWFGDNLKSTLDGLLHLLGCIHIPKKDEKDYYSVYRKPAIRHYEAMKSCTMKATTAYSNGQTSSAKKLSEQARVHYEAGLKADEKASKKIFAKKNKGLQGEMTIDLHGQHVKEAISILQAHLNLYSTSASSAQSLRVITGRGLHSAKKCKLKPAVINFVQRAGLPWREENPGSLLIELNGTRNSSLAALKKQRKKDGLDATCKGRRH